MMNFSAATEGVNEKIQHQHVAITSLNERFIEVAETLAGFLLLEKFLRLFGHGKDPS